MKAVFVALLALPAALASPTLIQRQSNYPAVPFTGQACKCAGAPGGDELGSGCLQIYGQPIADNFCAPFVSYGLPPQEGFTQEGCDSRLGIGGKATCKPVQICSTDANGFFKVC